MAMVDQVLAELRAFSEQHDAGETVHARRMLNLEPESAELLGILLRALRPGRVLEIGTSNGYSTIVIADAIRGGGGRLVSIDRDAGKQEMARRNLERAGVAEVVELRTGDATGLVAQMDGPWDAVFFDADRVSAPEQLRLLVPRLAERALLVADNVLSHPEEIRGYVDAVERLAGFRHVVVPIGKGLSVAMRG